MSAHCECGVEEHDAASASMWRSAVLRKCKNLGLRSHVVFRPPWLLERKEAPTELTWDFETGLPRYHWCFLAEAVEITFRRDLIWELEVKTRFKEKKLVRVRLDTVSCPRYGQLDYLDHGDTVVFLYPRLVQQELVVKLASHSLTIPCKLNAILTYSDSICRNERKGMVPVCFVCCQEGSLSTCKRCHVAQYCGRDCEKADWEKGHHKTLCKASRVIKDLVNLPKEPWRRWYRFDCDPNTGETFLAEEEDMFDPDSEVEPFYRVET